MMNRLLDNLWQRVPVSQLCIPKDLSPDELLETLNEISKENPYYVKSFLNNLFKTDIDQDEFYELFSEVINSKPLQVTDEDIITYKINTTLVRIKETQRLISGNGTTGLRTWEAALYLSLYISKNLGQFEDRRVLELGTGTGLVSLYMIKETALKIKNLIITDGDSTLIESLSHNFQLNKIPKQSNIRCQSLWWGKDPVPSDVDIIIAADVTYDSSVIPSLVDCIKTGLQQGAQEGLQQGAQEAFIAATIRNEETISVFEKEIVSKGLVYEVVSKVETPGELEESVWFSSITQEIRIYKVEQS